MWASSFGNGLFFLPNSGLRKVQFKNDEKPLAQSRHNKSILFGMSSGNIFALDGKKVEKFRPLEKYYNDFKDIVNVNYVSKDSWLICHQRNITFKSPGHKPRLCDKINCRSYKTIQSKYNNNYYLTSFSGVLILNPESGKINFDSRDILGKTKKIAEFKNEIYIATQTGLYKYIKNKPIRFLTDQIGESRVNDIEIYDGKLIISTSKNGIWVYDGKRAYNLNVKGGLISNQVNILRSTSRKTLWVATNLGLQEIKIDKNRIVEIKRFDLKTNILSSELVDLDDLGDYLILTSENGIYSLNNSFKSKLKKINLYIEDFLVNNLQSSIKKKDIQFGDNIKITALAPNYTKHPTAYFYRINNQEWIKNNSETFSFLHLSPGDYKVDFMAKSPFFLASNIASVSFKINEKWYQNAYFKILVILAFIISVSLFVRNRSLKLSERKRNILKTELLSLQSQMNPHFTFNSLNSIQGYMSSHNVREAQIYLADFAGLWRSILNQAKLHLISIEEEVNFIQSYLNLEKRRLDSQFEYFIQVDPEINSAQYGVPTLLIQPFVENAIWHGVAGLARKGEIFINFKIKDSQILCEIQDNGIGMKESEKKKKFRPYHNSTGIENCKARIRLFKEIYRENIELKLESNIEAISRTKVSLTFPIMSLNKDKT